MVHKIICIGRQFGSGGHEIAVRTGAKLGIRVYERDILHLACKYGELAVKTLEKADETATNPFLFQGVYEGNQHIVRGLPTSEVLFALQSHEIRRLASEEDCIFVGRCAGYVLRDAEVRLLKVFVRAPFEYLGAEEEAQEGLSPGKAVRMVKRMDKRRRCLTMSTIQGRNGEAAVILSWIWAHRLLTKRWRKLKNSISRSKERNSKWGEDAYRRPLSIY